MIDEKMRELESKIKDIYGKYFRESKIVVSRACLGTDTYFIKCYVAKNEKECAWNIIDNDMLDIMFRIKINGYDDFTLENCSKSYLIKPESKYLVYSRRNLSFRKNNGNVEKIGKCFEKFISNLKESLINDLNNGLIHENHEQLLREKLN